MWGSEYESNNNKIVNSLIELKILSSNTTNILKEWVILRNTKLQSQIVTVTRMKLDKNLYNKNNTSSKYAVIKWTEKIWQANIK